MFKGWLSKNAFKKITGQRHISKYMYMTNVYCMIRGSLSEHEKRDI